MFKIFNLFFFLFAVSGLSAQSFSGSFKCAHQVQNIQKWGNETEQYSSSAARSDTFDILHTHIALDISDFTAKTIKGSSTLSVTPKFNNQIEISFDLLKLNIDSILVDGILTTHHYNDTLLTVGLPVSKYIGDTFEVQVFYHGKPAQDITGWGGFYFTADYAWNLGVGFGADPHSYGRVWFPCFDNFVEKSTFSFAIRVQDQHMAVCNGKLQNTIPHSDNTTTYEWWMNAPLPSYLVAVGISDYKLMEFIHNGQYNPVPVQLAARANDTANVRASFQNLPGSIDAFESAYGPHPFEKVGYYFIPFFGGAMEHATNIAYPLFGADGSLTYESLMAHEFAHHWWGDWVTCKTAEDMWINEGWASYSENIFFEHVYGRYRYEEKVLNNHEDVLHWAHINDNGYKAISGISHAYTYGDHVYNKGADVAHTLRGYLGDSIFFKCLQGFLNNYAFGNASSEEFRDYLTTCSGEDMTYFFDNWVFEPGFTHFMVDSVDVVQDGWQYQVKVFIRQQIKEAPALFTEVPLEITFMDGQFQKHTRTARMSGECGIFLATLNFEPNFIAVDMERKISDAITSQYKIINQPENLEFEKAFATIDVKQLTEPSALIRVEHHWLAPDLFKSPHPGLHMNDSRFWTVDGIFSDNNTIETAFQYNGTKNKATNGYLDHTWLTKSSDSIVLMYREGTYYEWKAVSNQTNNPLGTVNTKRGTISIPSLKKGQYAFAIYDQSLSDTISPAPSYNCTPINTGSISPGEQPSFQVYPNPGKDYISVLLHSRQGIAKIAIYDLQGKLVSEQQMEQGTNITSFATETWQSGMYIVKVMQGRGELGAEKVMVIN